MVRRAPVIFCRPLNSLWQRCSLPPSISWLKRGKVWCGCLVWTAVAVFVCSQQRRISKTYCSQSIFVINVSLVHRPRATRAAWHFCSIHCNKREKENILYLTEEGGIGTILRNKKEIFYLQQDQCGGLEYHPSVHLQTAKRRQE